MLDTNEISFWSEIEEIECPCQGSGWAEFSNTWEQCFLHFRGQLHPESRLLLLDEPKRLAEEDRRSQLLWSIEQSQNEVSVLTEKLRKAYSNLRTLELELTNRTPTIKVEAVHFPTEAR